MKVFISWSGDTSKAIAEALRGWLPSVIQAVKPYYSPDDITKGARWNTEIAKELEECKVGLFCLTSDNLDAPWVMFEAGALSKSLSAARVCPLLFGIEPSDVKGPLVQFQAAPYNKDEIKKTVRMMNQELGSAGLAAEVIDSVFEMWWPKLDEKIKAILSKAPVPNRRVRPDRDILEEILARVRAAPQFEPRTSIAPGAIDDLMGGMDQLTLELERLPVEERAALSEIVERLRVPVNHIVTQARSRFDPSRDREVMLEMLRRRRPDTGAPPVSQPTTSTRETLEVGPRTKRRHP